ncbi:Calcineurin-like phosphoesterase [Arachidicoccus rhizosphaerae]|uniref:Calcineurin-like phosphoesterase n=2 Tax=Arachidicoccus rhizosphaerae TaxID=551991 RepID=A0A1H3VIA3_9BACT|nr:Calcineurin-like phosphoesterase [Arachidicoccus rhizosphaerae]
MKMMKIQIASDLHLEFKDNYDFIKKNPLVPTGEILILAGDIIPICLRERPEMKAFFTYCSDHFKWTYWLGGNHEFYNAELKGYTGHFVEDILPNVQFVNNHIVSYPSIDIILSTLWTKISERRSAQIKWQMNDYHKIALNGKDLWPEDSNDLFEQNLQFIQKALSAPKHNKRLIVTHHVPTLRNYPAAYIDSPLNEAFAVDLDDLILNSAIDFWVYGHHHSNTPPFTIGNTKMITNQLGYTWLKENKGFKSDLIILG